LLALLNRVPSGKFNRVKFKVAGSFEQIEKLLYKEVVLKLNSWWQIRYG